MDLPKRGESSKTQINAFITNRDSLAASLPFPHIKTPYDDLEPMAHPFLRDDEHNAATNSTWLQMAGDAFPGHYAFMGALILTEPWLAARVLPFEIWNVFEVLPAYSDAQLADLVNVLWSVVARANLNHFDKVCRKLGFAIFRRRINERWEWKDVGKVPGTVKQVTFPSFERDPTPFGSLDEFAISTAARIGGCSNSPLRDLFRAGRALAKLVQLGCLGARLCQRTSARAECACPLHVHRFPRTFHHRHVKNFARAFASRETSEKGWLQWAPHPKQPPKADTPPPPVLEDAPRVEDSDDTVGAALSQPTTSLQRIVSAPPCLDLPRQETCGVRGETDVHHSGPPSIKSTPAAQQYQEQDPPQTPSQASAPATREQTPWNHLLTPLTPGPVPLPVTIITIPDCHMAPQTAEVEFMALPGTVSPSLVAGKDSPSPPGTELPLDCFLFRHTRLRQRRGSFPLDPPPRLFNASPTPPGAP